MASRRPERGPVRGIDLERQVRRVLRTARSTAPIARARLERITGGFSNHAWRATSRDGERWFVRLGTPKALRLGADLTGERAMLEIAARTGLAPSVVRCDPGRGLLVTRSLLTQDDARVTAICDVNQQHLTRARQAIRWRSWSAGARCPA